MEYNFKHVLVDFVMDGEWMYMLDDKQGTVVYSYELVIEDEEDERVARSFGWSDEEIDDFKLRR